MADGRILITGATGFVGTRLAAVLQGRGVALTLATRVPRPDLAAPAIRVVTMGELGPGTAWSEALRDVSAVIHLAGRVHVAPERAEREAASFDAVNRAGSVRLFEAAASGGVGLFVFMSSIAVLGGESPPGAPFDDRSTPHPETVYARSKLAAEDALAALARASATRLVILRPPLIVGAGVGGNVRSLIRLADTPLPLPLGGIANRRTLLALDDLVAAIESVLRTTWRQPVDSYVLGDERPISTPEIVAVLRAALGRPTRLVAVPAAMCRLGAKAIGAEGAFSRLFGDLEVDTSRFRREVGPPGGMGARAALRDAAMAFRRR